MADKKPAAGTPGPIKRAVALRYDKGTDEAPTVVASGQGLIAEKIVDLATTAGVTIEQDAELADALSSVEIGTAIPEDLYPVVAEVLVFVSRMNKQRAKGRGGKPARQSPLPSREPRS